MSSEVIADFVRLGDGDAALLYIYLTATGGEKTSGEASSDLGWSTARTRSALDKLISNALMPGYADKYRAEAQQEAQGITQARPRRGAGEDPSSGKEFYSSFLQEVQRLYGRMLSSDELVRLFGVYDSLGLPPEVILQLIVYCTSETGGDRPPPIRYIEKAAYTWEREGIFTLELADNYIKQREEQRQEGSRIKKALSITDRDLSPTEKKFVDSWLALGYDSEAVAIAYDRTVTKTGRLTWKYMNSIINSWHGKGLHSVEDILEKDTRPERSSASSGFSRAGGSATPDERELERLGRMLESMNGENG